MRPPFVKSICYLLEGLNAFSTAYFFNYLLFLLRDEYNFGNFQNLAVGAGHGLVYFIASMVGGKLGQKAGYFTILRLGYAGLILSLVFGGLTHSLWTILVALTGWTISMCFTWPMLEALVCEHEDAAALPHRIGLYNLVWAGCSTMSLFFGGSFYEHLGPQSLFWLPVIIHVGQLILTFPLQRWHDEWLAQVPPIRGEAAVLAKETNRPRYFQSLAWLANPFAYMAINTLVAVVPGLAARHGLTVAQAGHIMSVWFFVRTASFIILWFWHGWHYHFRWFVASFLMLIGGFFAIMMVPDIWQLVLAQVIFGWATGLVYYSSLFYSMDGSETKGEHGGLHEALIGAGICGGPAIGAASLYLAPAHPNAAAWTVGVLMLVGVGGMFRLRGNAMRRPIALTK